MKSPVAFLWGLLALAACSPGNVEPQTWKAGPAIMGPGRPGAFDNIAVKDPTIVRYDGYWHIFYTAAGDEGFSIGYSAAPTFEELDAAPRHNLDYLKGANYAAAPQVFYFTPEEQWYLIYQTQESNYQPVYSTTRDIFDPSSWSAPKPLVTKDDRGKWIDFWVICDDENAYLFYTRKQVDVMVMSTPLDQFPEGFSSPVLAYSPIHEATAIYKVAGRDEYHLLYEEREDIATNKRKFGLATAPALSGPWALASDAYSAGGLLEWPEGATAWTDQVSHGEMIRTGYDEKLEYDPVKSRFLIQGFITAASDENYDNLPWRLGIITRSD